MILYERQYQALQKNLTEINASIANIEAIEDSKKDKVTLLGFEALKSFASDIHRDIEDYLLLKSGKFKPPKSFKLSELPRILIQTRIARGLSQEYLANAAELDFPRLKRYEEEEYFGASFSKLLEIADKLEIHTSECLQVWFVDKKIWRNSSDTDWNEFPIDEAMERGWVKKSAGESSAERFKAWFSKSIGPYGTYAHHQRGACQDKVAEDSSVQASMFAWQARVLQLAKEEIKKSPVNEFRLDDRWLQDLAKQTAYEDGPIRAKHCLKEKGIILVIVKDLPNTFLDGAAMLSHEGIPIVALTLRYNRLDYFWYTLFHELGHVYCDLFDKNRFHLNYFDQLLSADENQASHYREDEREIKANRFAMDKLIDAKTWDTCQSRCSVLVDDVRADAERIGVHPSVIAGRIRFERNDFSLLGNLKGQGQLHKHFPEYEL